MLAAEHASCPAVMAGKAAALTQRSVVNVAGEHTVRSGLHAAGAPATACDLVVMLLRCMTAVPSSC
jgi:hypothetical protein